MSIKSEREVLLATRDRLEVEIEEVDLELIRLAKQEKPFQAVVYAYSGTFSTYWKTEAQARSKYEEYLGKAYYLNGRVNGAALVQHHDEGGHTVLDQKKKYGDDKPYTFFPPPKNI